MSLGNLVEYNGQIGRVVWIQQREIGWYPNWGWEVISVPIKELKPVPITPNLLDDYLTKVQYLKKKNGIYEYDSSRHTSFSIEYRIQSNGDGAFFTIRDEDCSGDFTTVYFTKMHSLQNFITGIVRDLVRCSQKKTIEQMKRSGNRTGFPLSFISEK